MTARSAVLVAAVFVASLFAGAARAEPGSSVNRYVVNIEVDAPADVVARVREVSTEVLARLAVTPIVSSESRHSSTGVRQSPAPLAYAYVDLELPTIPRLVVVDGETQRELTRRTLPETSSLETSIETVTLVLYMTLESLISEHAARGPEERAARDAQSARVTRGVEAPAPPQPSRRQRARKQTSHEEPSFEATLAAPSAGESSPTGRERDLVAPNGSARDGAGVRDAEISVDIGAFLRIITLDNANALAGGGGAIEVRAERLTPRLGALFFVAAHSSADLSFEGTRATLTPFSARLLPTLSLPLAPRVSGLVGVGAGIDWFRAEVHEAPAGAERGGPSSTMDATLSALIGGRAMFGRHVSLNLAAGLDLDLSPRTFVVRSGDRREALLELARLRPSATLGFAISPTGGAP